MICPTGWWTNNTIRTGQIWSPYGNTSGRFVAEIPSLRSARLSRTWWCRWSWQTLLATPALFTAWVTDMKLSQWQNADGFGGCAFAVYCLHFLQYVRSLWMPMTTVIGISNWSLGSIWKGVLKTIHLGLSYKYECKKHVSALNSSLLYCLSWLIRFQYHGVSRCSFISNLFFLCSSHRCLGFCYVVSTPTQHAWNSWRHTISSWP